MPREKLKFNSYFKELLLERDFKYFMEMEIAEGDYLEEDINSIYDSYRKHSEDIKTQLRKNKKQFLNYLYGQVILMFDGGFLPALFRLDGFTRSSQILDFEGYGESYAYFKFWQKYERRKRNRQTAWDYITKVGAILAISLTIVKLLEAFAKSPR